MNKFTRTGYDSACQEGIKSIMNQADGEGLKRSIAQRMWLHYYNRVLSERGIIGEEERNRMSNRIDARAGRNFH